MTRLFEERGSATLELTILTPALLALLGLVIAAGRIEVAASAVEQAAASAAREASLARTPTQAQAAARRAGAGSLRDQGITCDPLHLTVDTRGFAVPVGQTAQVEVRIVCSLALSDQAVPGMPGTRTVRAHVTSPLDRYRSR
ncbi:MAG: TadE/TadG family type IV pilus assembly protein [Actinomycetota bacterium]